MIRAATALAVCFLLLAPALGVDPAPDGATAETEPRDLGLREKESARLAQIDVAVTGDPQIAAGLEPGDFRVRVALRRLREFTVDRFCPEPGERVDAQAVPARPATYLLYFDQSHLTMAGRARGIDTAKELVRRLVTGGARASIVSNADRMTTYAELTDDPEVLVSALRRLENDREQFDLYASQEEDRIDDIIREINDTESLAHASAVARRYQRYERWITDRNLHRLEAVLGRFAAVPPPKAVLYFADTMRSNPGEHYLDLFQDTARVSDPTLGAIQSDALTGRIAFDRVIEEAASHGVRFYTVLPEGLSLRGTREFFSSGGLSVGNALARPQIRSRHARASMASLASETGGAFFVNGERPSRIVSRVLEDRSCLYVISFDPAGFSTDTPLPLKVRVLREGVDARTRGQMVIQSETSRLTSQLLAAFAAPEASEADLGLSHTLLPVGFLDGEYRILLQVAVPGMPFPAAEWDLGASVVADDRVVSDTSQRLRVARAGSPVVLEALLYLSPGPYEIVSVAHEITSQQISSRRSRGELPDPDKGLAALGPIELLQPTSGAFLRDGDLRSPGSLGVDRDRAVRSDRPIALLGLVCRGKRLRGPLVVERRLVGEQAEPFPPFRLEPEGERCAQVRDLVPENTLGQGLYRYEMSVRSNGKEIARATREFVSVRSSPAE